MFMMWFSLVIFAVLVEEVRPPPPPCELLDDVEAAVDESLPPVGLPTMPLSPSDKEPGP